MSRLELSAIQSKLKAAIQSHQMLVVKMKGDNQNATLKKGLTELQEEIKRLSDEQKKIVEKVRENLVKPSLQTQAQQPVTSIATLGQTITAIGQPRLVSFPTQGSATILPVGMVAVPIAHMQRPAVGMAIHPANAGPISQATSISIIPTGILSTGCNISLNPISLGNTVSGIIHGNIAVNNLGSSNLINNTTTVSSPGSGIAVVDSSINNSTSTISVGSGNVAAMVGSGCIPSSSTSLTSLTNMTNVIFSSGISNGQNGASNGSHLLPNNNNNNTGSSNGSVNLPPTTSAILPAAPVSTMSVSGSGAGIVISQFPQQPLVQPQLLQQQQQQILQMIQQQQLQQQPQQRLASHMPIKVPQYTASVIRPVVSSNSIQFCNIAPAPSSVTTTSSVRLVTSSTSSSLTAKAVVSKETTVTKEQQQLPKQDVSKPQHHQQPQQQQQQYKQPPKQQQQQPAVQQEQHPCQTAAKILSQEEQEKLEFMKALDLFTLDALREVLNRRSERKRRTTANPNYSFGFEFNRRDKNGSIWATISPKKARTARGKSFAMAGRGNGWTDSTTSTYHQSRASNKSNKSDDNHDDYCAACGKGGQLLMCETCRLVYHLDCLSPPLTEAPKYAWSCPKCLVSGKGFQHLNSEALAKVQSYIAKKAAKEEERKKVQRKGKEINVERNQLESKNKELDAKIKEQADLHSKLSAEEKKVKEELSKLSDFVQAMRESRTTEHLSGTKQSAT